MPEPQEQRALKILANCFILMLILIAVGLFMQSKVTEFLNVTLEKTVARHAYDVSLLAEERFERELTALRLGADLITAAPEESEKQRTLVALTGTEGGVTVGLTAPDGRPLYGPPLREKDFPRLPLVKNGGVVDFCLGRGLLFAVPDRDGNILYRLYEEKVLIERFGLIEVSAGSRMLIQDSDGDVIIPYKDFRTSDHLLFSHPGFQKSTEVLRDRLLTEPASAVYCETEHGDFFLCGAKLPHTNFLLIGYVPWAAVGGDIASIYTLLIRTGCVLILVLALVGAYLLFLHGRYRTLQASRYENILPTTASPLPTSAPASAPTSAPAPAAAPASKYLDVNLGLTYTKGMESLYWEMLEIFCELRDETMDKLNSAFLSRNWSDYVILVHSLRSSALAVGGQKLSDAARTQEETGRRLLHDESLTESDRAKLQDQICGRHAPLAALYDATVKEAMTISRKGKK